MKFSIAVSTARGFEEIEPLFRVSSPDAEIIIIDSNYNENTKNSIMQIKHEYCKVTYAPSWKVERKLDKDSIYAYKNDKNRCRNVGIAYSEGEWVYRLDDCTEFCPDFFKILADGIEFMQKRLGHSKFVIRPIKLEEWSKHEKWEDYPLLKDRNERFFELQKYGFAGTRFFETLDQFIATRESIDVLNGMEELFDVGHGHDDRDIFQRFLALGYKVFLDKNLKTFQYGHKRSVDPIPFTQWVYDVLIIGVQNGGRFRAYNSFDLKEMRQQMLPLKEKYIIKNEEAQPLSEEGVKKSDEPHISYPGNPPEVGMPDTVKITENRNPKHFTGTYPFDMFFNPESLAENKKKLMALKDKHKGEDLFILGNSPDVTKDFVDRIRNKISFASNGFVVARDAWNFEPTYIVVTNQGTFDNHLRNMRPEFTIDGQNLEGGSVAEVFFKMQKAQFVMSDLILKPVLLNLQCMRKNERVSFLEKNTHVRILNRSEFEPPYEIDLEHPPILDDLSFDLEKGTYLCGTVITDLMIPLAVWMGFKNIYLKGCSGGAGHFYDKASRHFWSAEKQSEIYSDLYSLFKQKLDSIGVGIYNLDSPSAKDKSDEKESLIVENPTKYDGHFWDGQLYATNHTLGKPPYVIEHRNLEDVL